MGIKLALKKSMSAPKIKAFESFSFYPKRNHKKVDKPLDIKSFLRDVFAVNGRLIVSGVCLRLIAMGLSGDCQEIATG